MNFAVTHLCFQYFSLQLLAAGPHRLRQFDRGDRVERVLLTLTVTVGKTEHERFSHHQTAVGRNKMDEEKRKPIMAASQFGPAAVQTSL